MDYMHKALELAEQGQYSCPPNPMVGCVITKNNNVVGTGFHVVTGGPHAEIIALKQAGQHAFQADVYVTLEPCSHFGRTPPCVDALIKAKIKRVFIALVDPNPRVDGEGLRKLRDAGIEIHLGSHEEEAYKLNEDFFHSICHKRPFVIAKWAMSMDGKIATQSGQSKYITSKNALAHAHSLRARVCAIMIGAGTLRQDNPQLSIRHGISDNPIRQPRPIIVSAHGRFSLDSVIFNSHRNPVVILGDATSLDFIKQLEARKIEYYIFKLAHNKLPMPDIFSSLSNFKSILIEGGNGLLTSLHEENLINQIYTYIAPKIIAGKDSLTPMAGQNIGIITHATELHSQEVYNLSPDICFMAKTSATARNYGHFLSSLETKHV